MLNLQNLENIKKKYYFFYLNGIDASNPFFSHFILESACRSSIIYGCDFNYTEATEFLSSGKTAQGKDFFDYLVIQNIYDASLWFFEKLNPNFSLDLSTLIKLNTKLLKGIEYRVKNRGGINSRLRVVKGGLRKEPINLINDNRAERESQYNRLKTEVQKLLDDIYYTKNPSLGDIADFYGRFTLLRPFDMGNGRTLRIAVNQLFYKAGLPLISFDENDKEAYEKAIAHYTEGDKDLMNKFLNNRLESSLAIFEKAI